MPREHVKTTLFSLVGRRIELFVACNYQVTGEIIEQIGPARYRVRMDGLNRFGQSVIQEVHRAEFHLPRLPRREAVWLGDDYDGFVYADCPGFENPFAKVL